LELILQDGWNREDLRIWTLRLSMYGSAQTD
jgi:hypothetical protein